MSGTSALYAGTVVHARQRPKRHSLRYRVFSMLIDLDDVENLDRSLKLFGYNRRGVFSFWDKDHGSGETGALRTWVEGHLRQVGIDKTDTRIRILCYPRMFGYVFNPLTIYFCEDPDGRLLALLYEVCNTFKERHTYIIPAAGASDGAVRHSCAKAMYVSPFVPMDCTYDFDITPPGERVRIDIHERDADGPLLFAGFAGRRKPLDDRGLLKMLVTYPLMTLKVVAGIHWEAFRLWRKGVPIHRHRPAAKPIASSVETAV
ncbi:DUF1365 domain-containing protein [Rhizobium sp. 0TCS1.26]|uniref:DUF1365 domain-containing protein n=1 Tax=Rhizobium sp. 0TCS1.26 TaxID=3142623 RepID=UPI003D2D2B48